MTPIDGQEGPIRVHQWLTVTSTKAILFQGPQVHLDLTVIGDNDESDCSHHPLDGLLHIYSQTKDVL